MGEATACFGTLELAVTADGEGLVSGAPLLLELADRVGLSCGPSEAMGDVRERLLPAGSRPGVVRLGCDACRPRRLRDRHGGLRWSGTGFGARASKTTTHRVMKAVDNRLLDRARTRVWGAAARRTRSRSTSMPGS